MTMTAADDKTRLQALSLINDCYKYIMDLTTNGVIIIDAIQFVQNSKEKLNQSSQKEDDRESKEPNYNDNEKTELEDKQEEETREVTNTTNQTF